MISFPGFPGVAPNILSIGTILAVYLFLYLRKSKMFLNIELSYCAITPQSKTMKQTLNSEKNNNTESMPRATLIVPYSQEMKNGKLLADILEASAQRKEKVLKAKYTQETVVTLMKLLRDALTKITSVPNDKTLIVFVSPVLEKCYFITPEKKLTMPSVEIQK